MSVNFSSKSQFHKQWKNWFQLLLFFYSFLYHSIYLYKTIYFWGPWKIKKGINYFTRSLWHPFCLFFKIPSLIYLWDCCVFSCFCILFSCLPSGVFKYGFWEGEKKTQHKKMCKTYYVNSTTNKPFNINHTI